MFPLQTLETARKFLNVATVRINFQCDRDSEEVPCKRCARKNRICGSSYLPHADPKPATKCNVDFKDPQIVAAWEEFKKHIRVGVPRPAVAGLGGLSTVINNHQEGSVAPQAFDDAAEWDLHFNEWVNLHGQ